MTTCSTSMIEPLALWAGMAMALRMLAGRAPNPTPAARPPPTRCRKSRRSVRMPQLPFGRWTIPTIGRFHETRGSLNRPEPRCALHAPRLHPRTARPEMPRTRGPNADTPADLVDVLHYLGLRNHIAARIASGELKAGDRLPSERLLQTVSRMA